MRIRNILLTAAACGLLSAAVVSGTMAYMTDSEHAVNVVHIGQVKIDLQEPHYDPEDAKDLHPNQSVDKDPQVKNTGRNDAIVFVDVKIPTKTLSLASSSNGKRKEEETTTDMFWYKTGFAGTAAAEANGLDEENSYDEDSWFLIEDSYQNADGSSASSVVDGGYHSYVFALKTKLPVGETSPTIFDRVQLKYIVEGTLDKNTTYYMPILGYAIQEQNVLENSGDLTTNLTKENLTKIYRIYKNQNPQ